MVASQTSSISPRLSETWRSLVIIALAALLIAASWRGVSVTQEDPRGWNDADIAKFILGTVNSSLSIGQWKRGDTVTICQAGSSRCILVVYANIMSHDAWLKARDTDSRNAPPDVSLWERFLKWFLGRGGVPSTVSLETLIAEWGEVPTGTVTVEPLRPDDTLTKCTGCHGSDWQQIAQRPAWEPLRSVEASGWLALIGAAAISVDARHGWSKDDWQLVRRLSGDMT